MKGTVIKNALSAALGAICGAVGAYYLTKKYVSEDYEETINEIEKSVEGARRSLQDKVNELSDIINVYEKAGLSFETAKVIAAKNEKAVVDTNERIASDLAEASAAKKIIEDQGYVNYSKIGESQDVKVETEPEVVNFTPTEESAEEPYIISVDDFTDNHEEYRKVSATFYTEDQVLCETSHNEIIDIRHVGGDLVSDYDGDLIYVRNDYLGIDYEIDIYHSSYAYEVLGEEQLEE